MIEKFLKWLDEPEDWSKVEKEIEEFLHALDFIQNIYCEIFGYPAGIYLLWVFISVLIIALFMIPLLAVQGIQ